MFNVIRQLEERNVANEIEIMLWSDRMDLVALSNNKGEVALHRLTWTRAWSLAPDKDGNTVKGMAWRPDGKVLAIAYSSGQIFLINIENKKNLHTVTIDSECSCLYWVREQIFDAKVSTQEEQNDYMKYLDYSSTYLPDPPPLSSVSSTNTTDESQNFNFFQDQTDLNLLVVGTSTGYLHISVFGILPWSKLNLNNYVETACSVLSVHLTDDLSSMFVSVNDRGNINVLIIGTEILKTHKKELFSVALKYVYLNSLLTYLSSTITTIKETWENMLLEMDAKLCKYASKVPEGTVTADFLDLLMFGITSEEMEEFLLHDLTEKGLKKFGQTIEMCYSNIQKLLLKHVTKVGQNITYHLAELRGMARLEHRYNMVGLSEDLINVALDTNGAFLIKAGEMQQILNHSINNYKAFFRWLYAVIFHLMDEQVPPEIPKMTQQDLAYITEFVQNFDKIGSSSTPDDSLDPTRKNYFVMERLGQYLSDGPLKIPPNMGGNIWANFLKENKCVRDHSSILKHFEEMSLIQQFLHLQFRIGRLFEKPKNIMDDHFSLKKCVSCLKLDGVFRVTQANITEGSTLIVFLSRKPPADGIYFLEVIHADGDETAKCAFFYFPQPCDQVIRSENYYVLDVKFYSVNVLSILMQENSSSKTAVLYQFPAAIARENLAEVDCYENISKQNVPKVNGCKLILNPGKIVEDFVASSFAVSGCRRVSIVVSENRRKVRLFEMEAEDEDEEDGDITNSTARESDTSGQEASGVE